MLDVDFLLAIGKTPRISGVGNAADRRILPQRRVRPAPGLAPQVGLWLFDLLPIAKVAGCFRGFPFLAWCKGEDPKKLRRPLTTTTPPVNFPGLGMLAQNGGCAAPTKTEQN